MLRIMRLELQKGNEGAAEEVRIYKLATVGVKAAPERKRQNLIYLPPLLWLAIWWRGGGTISGPILSAHIFCAFVLPTQFTIFIFNSHFQPHFCLSSLRHAAFLLAFLANVRRGKTGWSKTFCLKKIKIPT